MINIIEVAFISNQTHPFSPAFKIDANYVQGVVKMVLIIMHDIIKLSWFCLGYMCLTPPPKKKMSYEYEHTQYKKISLITLY